METPTASDELLFEATLASPAAMADLAANLAPLLRAGDVIGLEGELGTGKTTFARALIRTLGLGQEEVPSPTFTLVQTYETDGLTVWHCDLYRIERPEDAVELGLDEAFGSALTLIEWPERLGRDLPPRRLRLGFAYGDDETARRVTVMGGREWRRRLEGLFDDG